MRPAGEGRRLVLLHDLVRRLPISLLEEIQRCGELGRLQLHGNSQSTRAPEACTSLRHSAESATWRKLVQASGARVACELPSTWSPATAPQRCDFPNRQFSSPRTAPGARAAAA